MLLFFFVLIAALVFEYINGFHDAANAIATVVSTKVLTPRQAILMAASMNLVGAMIGVKVAKTISEGFIAAGVVNEMNGIKIVLAALIGAIIWNLVTWLGGIPSSSSHALIGGLCGAVLAQTKMMWGALLWDTTITKTITDNASNITTKVSHVGLWPKLIQPMVCSPIAGFILGICVMFILTALLVKVRPAIVQRFFGKLQITSAALMGFSHGMNDAQKTMGIITMALIAGSTASATSPALFDDLPDILSFLKTENDTVPLWVRVTCAITMGAGTATGGWRIIRTMGHKMVKLQPVHGFAAETSAVAVIQFASHFGIPLSTTHVISTSIMGVGAMKRFSAVKWGIVGRLVWAWVLTIPITAGIGYGSYQIVHLLF